MYDHIAWSRGLTDGFTCRCRKAKQTRVDPGNDHVEDDSGFYDIYGEEDGNLTGEC